MCDREKLDKVSLICLSLLNINPDSHIAKEIESSVIYYVTRDEIESFFLEKVEQIIEN